MSTHLSEQNSGAGRRLAGSLLAVFAVLTCPCYLPIWLAALAGTSAGAALSQMLPVALPVLTLLFFAFLAGAWRMLGSDGK